MNNNHKKLSSDLKAAGVDSEFFRLNKRWTALKVFFKDTNLWFWVRHSSRGWFLGDTDVFEVPDSTNMFDVCIAYARETELRRRTINSHGLQLRESWMRDENEFERRVWQSVGWERISNSECESLCDSFQCEFAYPGEQFPSLSHFKTWDFSYLYERDLSTFDCSSAKLNLACFTAFRKCLAQSEDLLAIDWNNDCFRLAGTSELTTGSPDMWPISVFPNGDYHIFVATDFRLGVLSDPSGSLCAFGDQMAQNMAAELCKSSLP